MTPVAAAVTISIAQSDELDQVAQLYALAGYGGGISGDDLILIARTDAGLIGAVRLCSEGDFKVLRGMQVHPGFQRQGIGRMLLSACAPCLGNNDAYCLPYTHLVRFYEQVQFKVVEDKELPLLLSGRLASYVSAGQPVLAMKRAGLRVSGDTKSPPQYNNNCI